MSMFTLMCPTDSIPSNYTRHLLTIEETFDLCRAYHVFTANWTLCFYFMAAYLVAIIAGRYYMASREAFQVHVPMLLWNIFLASYSSISAWRMLTAMAYDVQMHGFHASICTMSSNEHRQAVGLWVFLFVGSKIVELGDTVFIVLRKSNLTFLHVYHHLSVVFFVWSIGVYASPMHAYYGTLNVTVHSIMYSYYVLNLLKIKIPKQLKMAITVLQLLQMVAGIFLTAYMYYAKATDPTCFICSEALLIGATIYFTYFLLFLMFFINAYSTNRKPKSTSNGQYAKKLE